jgi:hypothetical protein
MLMLQQIRRLLAGQSVLGRMKHARESISTGSGCNPGKTKVCQPEASICQQFSLWQSAGPPDPPPQVNN